MEVKPLINFPYLDDIQKHLLHAPTAPSGKISWGTVPREILPVFVFDVDDQGEGDGAVGYEAAEVFAQSGVVEQVLAGLGGNNKQSVKQKNPDNGMPYSGALNAGAAG